MTPARLTAGSVLLVAHDLHEAPWGLGQQLNELISTGLHGDAVLIPEPLCDTLPIAGRGAATWKVAFRRSGAAVHEVMRPADEPSVIAAGARFVDALATLAAQLSASSHPIAGSESVFVGQMHSGEIYNQYPQECWLEGTRRWLPDSDDKRVEQEFRALVSATAAATGTRAIIEWRPVRGAFRTRPRRSAGGQLSNCLCEPLRRGVAHGRQAVRGRRQQLLALCACAGDHAWPAAGGQHTVHEWVSIDSLVRVAQLYALIAALYCSSRIPSHRAAVAGRFTTCPYP